MPVELLLSVGFAGLLLLGLLIYLMRRPTPHRETLKALIAYGTPWRPLTTEERAALVVVLRQTGNRDDLVRDGVFTLTGALLATPGIVTGEAGTTYTLGGVSVFLPWDALDHVNTFNECEVVLTPRTAIVIGMNDSFDLVEAWHREHAYLQRPEAARSPANRRATATPTHSMGQRAESTAEVAARTHSLRAWALLALGLALASSVLASQALANWQTLWASTSALFGLLAAWGLWRPVRLSSPGRVNRLRGPLTWGDESGKAARYFLLGLDPRPLTVPPHWQPMLAQCADAAKTVELDVRAHDHSVVRLAPSLSVHEEVNRHPPVFWGHHLAAALAAPLIAAVAWWWSDSLAVDLQQGLRWVSGAQARAVDSPESLQARPPAVGDWVHLKGMAQCEVPRSPPLAARTCDTLRWGGQPPVWPLLTVDEPTQLLSDGSYMQSVGEPFLRRSPLGLPSALAMGQQGVFIRNVPELVQAVEEVCDAQPGPACADLKDKLRQAIRGTSGEALASWQALLAAGQGDQLERSTSLSSLDALQLHALAKEAARPALARGVQASLDALAQSQQGGAVLVVRRTERSAPREAGGPMDPLKVWESHQPEARLSKLQTFDLLGVVTARAIGADDPVWTLLPRSASPDFWRTGLPLLWLTVALLLLVVHGPLAVRGAWAASRRRRRINGEAKRRWLAATPPLLALAKAKAKAKAASVPATATLGRDKATAARGQATATS